jgi:hypothetical protein
MFFRRIKTQEEEEEEAEEEEGWTLVIYALPQNRFFGEFSLEISIESTNI